MKPDQRRGGRRTHPLVAAVLKGHADVVKVLVKHGADVEVVDADGNRPLHGAASRGNAEVARRPCKAKADKAAPGQSGATLARHVACRKGREEVVEVLVEAGARPGSCGSERVDPLHAAAAGGREEIVEFLLENGADPTAKDAKGKTAKSVASKKGYEDIAKTIKRGAIKEKREEEERRARATEFFVAARRTIKCNTVRISTRRDCVPRISTTSRHRLAVNRRPVGSFTTITVHLAG